MNRIRFLIFSVFLMLYSSPMIAKEYKQPHITNLDGLPHSQVETITQDRKGYIWIGTRNGLAKYDGYSIRTYYHNDKIANSLCHNFIHKLFVDHKHRLWICTENGICRYRPSTDDFKNYPSSKGMYWTVGETPNGKIIFGGNGLSAYDEKTDRFTSLPLIGGSINAIAVNSRGTIYVAGSSNIFTISPDLRYINQLPPQVYQGVRFGSYGTMPLFFDSRGYLWIGRNGQGVMRVNLRTMEKTVYDRQLSNGIVRIITEDSEHNIWLGTEGGINILTAEGSIQLLQHTYDAENSLSDNAIYAIFCDKHKNMWVGSYFGGVDKILNTSEKFHLYRPGYGSMDIKARVARGLAEPQQGVYWIATEDNGINILNSLDQSITKFSGIPSLGSNVHSLYYDYPAKEMWIGTRFNGLFRYSLSNGATKHYLMDKGLNSEGIFHIARQRSGRIWLATMKGIRWYDPVSDTFRTVNNKRLSSCFIYTIMIDKADNVWAGSASDGLFEIRKDGKIRHYAKGTSTGLKDNYIISLFESSDHRIWIGTNNNGLQVMKRPGSCIFPVDHNDDLQQSTICSICEAPQGTMWITTSKGLFKYNLKANFIEVFNSNNGLPVDQFNYSSSAVTHDGHILLGTINGLIEFNPQHTTSIKGPLYVHFKQLSINNQMTTTTTDGTPLTNDIDETQKLVLSRNQAHSFTIEYGAIAPGYTTGIEYQVWVEGIDKGWSNVGNERIFYGYNLPPGTYKLHVRANESDNNWDKCPIKTLIIKVRPPFYLSLWAYLFYIIFFAAIGCFLYHFFMERMKKRNAVKMANIEKQKTEELDKAKINFFTMVAHELKTPLALIMAPLKSISRSELSPKSQKYLDLVFRNAQKMQELIDQLVTFNKIQNDHFSFYLQKGNPLDFIQKLVTSFYNACADKKIRFSIIDEDNGEDVWFSPGYVERIVFNLLSNALKFTPDGGSISIRSKIENEDGSPYDYLNIVVSDTGIGIDPKEIDNIFNRFYQTQRGYSQNNSGWGLGLSLVKQLVGVHKGHISVASVKSKGTTFTVTLCVSAGAFPEKARINDENRNAQMISKYKFTGISYHADQDNTNQAMKNEDKLKVLMVEDNPDMLSFLKQYFSESYDVCTAEDGEKALTRLQEDSIDFIVSDVMMPGIDGIELCRRIKGDVRTSHIPVILLTAKTATADTIAGYESGADAYIAKPFEPRILELQIKNIIKHNKEQQKEIVNDGTKENIDSSSLNELDKKFLQQINDLIDNNINNSDFAIVDITREIGISRSLLHTKMKHLTAMSMGDYIRKKRMMKACRLLSDGYNVSETAYSVGFSDPNYFSKTFKKYFGKNPSEYVNETKR